ncbi:MAG: ATP-dependent DNA ligase, partial [Jiangellaceae bacterium]
LLAGLVSGELRQGALDGVLTEAVAVAAAVPAAEVRRAVTVAGTLTPVAQAVLAGGTDGLRRFRLAVGSPLRPMLAQSAPDLADAFVRTGPAAVEWKLDGIRVQIHRDGDRVAVFTRTLDDVTERVPELVEAAMSLPVAAVVLDGEAIALGPDQRPLPFQQTASRIGRRLDVATARAAVPLSTYVFDCLHLDGHDLVGSSGNQRWAALTTAVPESLLVPRLVTDDMSASQAFFDDALAHGHEGVVVKSLSAPYDAGRRGAGWIKVKPRHTLDLVVLAVEWGHGRRQGKLSNLHLGARDPDGRYGPPGGFVMLGKTFKGLTDAMLGWQTEQLLALADGPTDGWVVTVRPELVVEIAFDGVQQSPRYPAGLALRFARVLHHRPDKPAVEADTIASVREIHDRH